MQMYAITGWGISRPWINCSGAAEMASRQKQQINRKEKRYSKLIQASSPQRGIFLAKFQRLKKPQSCLARNIF